MKTDGFGAQATDRCREGVGEDADEDRSEGRPDEVEGREVDRDGGLLACPVV